MGSMVLAPLDAAVAKAVQKISRITVPDMPDRIIAATAVHLNADLVTRDRRLQAALGNRSIWVVAKRLPHTTLAVSCFIFSA
jgi:predicted nucleic acid-binding protein